MHLIRAYSHSMITFSFIRIRHKKILKHVETDISAGNKKQTIIFFIKYKELTLSYVSILLNRFNRRECLRLSSFVTATHE